MSDEAEAAKVVSAAGVWRLLGAIFALVLAVAAGAFYVAEIQARLSVVERDQESIREDVNDHIKLDIHPVAKGMVERLHLEIGHMHEDRAANTEAIIEAIKDSRGRRRRR